VQRAKFVHRAAAPAAAAAAAAPARPAQLDTKQQRMYKLRAARAAMMDVHTTTQQGESHDFAQDQAKAQLREKEVGPDAHAPLLLARARADVPRDRSPPRWRSAMVTRAGPRAAPPDCSAGA
jgi:hypothetical protein